jgi:Rrf2 family iron-sulfur cluster assembly transcriptional regulator
MAKRMEEKKNIPVSLALLSEQENISVRYLEQIFGKLRTTGIIKGKRGPGGGYVFGIPPKEISLYDVVSVLETEFLPASCLSEGVNCSPSRNYEEKRCPLEESCVTRPLWLNLREMYNSFMKNHSLADLVAGDIQWGE